MKNFRGGVFLVNFFVSSCIILEKGVEYTMQMTGAGVMPCPWPVGRFPTFFFP